MQYDILLVPNHNWDGQEMVFTSLIWYIIELANVTKTIIPEIEDQFFSIVLFHIIKWGEHHSLCNTLSEWKLQWGRGGKNACLNI